MLESVQIWLGSVALIWTLLAVGLAVGTQQNGVTTLAGVVGFALWGVWTFGAFQIVTLSNGTEFVYTEPELALVGVILAIPCGYIALVGPVNMAGQAADARLEDL